MAALPITLLVRRGIEGKSESPPRKKPVGLQPPSYDPAEPKEEQVGKDWMVQRVWDSIDPIFFVNDTGIACNNPGTAPSSYIPIEAGQDLTAIYWYWLHPVGPMSVWLADCDGPCEDVDVNQLDFFKIWEAGLLEGNMVEGMWYQKQFQKWDGSPATWPVTIPSTLKPGLYVVRHEILSIHIADSRLPNLSHPGACFPVRYTTY